jgi:hypothetical protein
MGFSRWLRSNAEYHLQEDTQRRMARRYGLSPPVRRPGVMATLWRRVFVPTYRILPWGLRRWIMGIMPGSHRRPWHDRAPPLGREAPATTGQTNEG